MLLFVAFALTELVSVGFRATKSNSRNSFWRWAEHHSAVSSELDFGDWMAVKCMAKPSWCP